MTLIELRTEGGVTPPVSREMGKQSDAIGKWIEECEILKHLKT